MPLYEYKCQGCGFEFEKLASNAEDIVEKCPRCFTLNPKKKFSTFAVGTGIDSCDSLSNCGSCSAPSGCPYLGD